MFLLLFQISVEMIQKDVRLNKLPSPGLCLLLCNINENQEKCACLYVFNALCNLKKEKLVLKMFTGHCKDRPR